MPEYQPLTYTGVVEGPAPPVPAQCLDPTPCRTVLALQQHAHAVNGTTGPRDCYNLPLDGVELRIQAREAESRLGAVTRCLSCVLRRDTVYLDLS
jgi:hypothetical protein